MDYGRVVVADDLGTGEMRSSRLVVYDRDIGVRLLFEDPDSGAEHYLIRYPTGLWTRLHRIPYHGPPWPTTRNWPAESGSSWQTSPR